MYVAAAIDVVAFPTERTLTTQYLDICPVGILPAQHVHRRRSRVIVELKNLGHVVPDSIHPRRTAVEQYLCWLHHGPVSAQAA